QRECLATRAMIMPQAWGAAKARRNETCRPPSTIAARKTSTPPCSSAVGGTCSASNVAMTSSPVTACLRRRDHVCNRRQREFFEVGRVRHRHVLAGDAGHGCVQPIESLFGHARGDFRPDARLPPTFFDGHDTAGLLYRLDDRLCIHRLCGAEGGGVRAECLLGAFIG